MKLGSEWLPGEEVSFTLILCLLKYTNTLRKSYIILNFFKKTPQIQKKNTSLKPQEINYCSIYFFFSRIYNTLKSTYIC